MSESSEQAHVVEWARMMEGVYPELGLLFSTLNGIPIPGSDAVRFAIINRMKKEGMKKGVPDLLLLVPRSGFHGMAIEMKVGRNRPTPEQTEYLDRLTEQGYLAVACWGAEEAIDEIEKYLQEAD